LEMNYRHVPLFGYPYTASNNDILVSL